MKRSIITALAAAVVWAGAGVNLASAQFGGLGQRSKAQTIFTPGGGFQTYGVIRTPQDANQLMIDQRVIMGLNPDGSLKVPIASQGESDGLGGLVTGHPVTFFDYGNYFPRGPIGGFSTTGGIGGLGGLGAGFGTTPFGQQFGNQQIGPRLFFGGGVNRFR